MRCCCIVHYILSHDACCTIMCLWESSMCCLLTCIQQAVPASVIDKAGCPQDLAPNSLFGCASAPVLTLVSMEHIGLYALFASQLERSSASCALERVVYTVHLSKPIQASQHLCRVPANMQRQPGSAALTWLRVAPAIPKMMMFHTICSRSDHLPSESSC